MNASSCEEVYIVGIANSAIYFSKYACRVVVLIRAALTKNMSQYLIDQIKATTNLAVRTESRVAEM